MILCRYKIDINKNSPLKFTLSSRCFEYLRFIFRFNVIVIYIFTSFVEYTGIVKTTFSLLKMTINGLKSISLLVYTAICKIVQARSEKTWKGVGAA